MVEPAPQPIAHRQDQPPASPANELEQAPQPVPSQRGLALGSPRRLVELAVGVLLAVLSIRLFVVEPYVIPSGSMAPGLIGHHRDFACTGCGQAYQLGLDEHDEEPNRPVCPNCGLLAAGETTGEAASGDRVLVLKQAFAFRSPRRWEPVVFWMPELGPDPAVKRVAALPNESIEVRQGDLYIDGALLRKDLATQRTLRILVYDHDHRPPDHAYAPRWEYRAAAGSPERWHVDGLKLVAAASHTPSDPRQPVDWLTYRHWQPERQAPGPVRDFLDYNGLGWSGDYRVPDLMLDFSVALAGRDGALHLALGSRADRLEVRLARAPGEPAAVTWNGTPVDVEPGPGSLAGRPGTAAEEFHRVEASFFDRRLLVAIDGKLAFDPVDLPAVPEGAQVEALLPGLGISGETGSAVVRHVRIYRDIYYTPHLSGSFDPAHASGVPYRLGPDEYFVLGDNSPVSNDSRFWAWGPVVRRDQLLGKPLLVYAPGRQKLVSLWGLGPYWVPDPGSIRYIR